MKLKKNRSTRVVLFSIAFPLLMFPTLGCKSSSRDRFAALQNQVDQSITPDSIRPVIASDGTVPESTVVGSDEVALVSTDMPMDQVSANTLAHASITQSTKPPATDLAMNKVPTLHTLQSGEDITDMIKGAPGTVLVDFYADWCGPCKTQGKVLHKVEEFAAQNQARIIKVDVDAHKALAKQLDVTTLPTLLVIKDGKVVDRKVGLNQEPQIRKMLQ